MRYTQLTESDVQHMLRTIGARRIDDLFAGIPDSARLTAPLDLPEPMNELGLLKHLEELGKSNTTCDELTCFLGGGVYDHFIPTVVDALSSQSEFVTAYTPYQSEASQGALQAFYEYQTMICQLTGMDVSNASLYEGATAAAEAVLMARSTGGRKRVVLSGAVHPDIREVIATYVHDLPIEPVIVDVPEGVTPLDAVRDAVNDDTAAVLVQTPNVFGCLERLDQFAQVAHDAGALLIASVDPISCALLKRPGELGADIVVGDGQSMGIPMSYGGPSLGFMACRDKLMRRLPGRLIGATKDRIGRRAYCLTLQAREQHIRRDRATSNICTNQGLMALRVAIYLCALGRRGLSRVADMCLDKAHYAAERISALDGYDVAFDQPFFKEFTVRTSKNVEAVLQHCRDADILGGVPLGTWYADRNDCFLVAVTEKRTKDEIDRLVDVLAGV